MTAEKRHGIVDRITPAVRAAIDSKRDEIVARASFARRQLVRLLWPWFLAEVPTILEAGVEWIERELES